MSDELLERVGLLHALHLGLVRGDAGGHCLAAIEAWSEHFEERRTLGLQKRAFVQEPTVGDDGVPSQPSLRRITLCELDPHV